ncbi:MAG: efflux RND transporter periplasmic adaptor subunit [Planctomycetes bacterium]|nr:efflux RND transporter periplasmic adaptor subunit [Planctomycetota bacterium]
MTRLIFRGSIFIIGALALFYLGRAIYDRVQDVGRDATNGSDPVEIMKDERNPNDPPAASRPLAKAAPVEVAEVARGPIERRRIFNGSLEANTRFAVAPKISGRVERLTVDVADSVRRGTVVAELDSDEFRQAVAQAEAELAVWTASLAQARAHLELQRRTLERVVTLSAKGIASEGELDVAQAETLAGQAGVELSEARVRRADSEVDTAKTRLGYTRVTADWDGGGDLRHVAQRFVDVGDTVAANAPLFAIVELDPMKGIMFVTERDYGSLQTGQTATLTTEAFPQRPFKATITRIAPEFRAASRQARVELLVENPERLLKPGMFAQAEVVFEHVADAVLIPAAALVQRAGQTGVFRVSDDGDTVDWYPVTTGIRQGDAVQIVGSELSGWVVTLGHQLVEQGSRVVTSRRAEKATTR